MATSRVARVKMTAVVGVSLLSEVIMVADTRLSWPGTSAPPEDILQKLYAIPCPRNENKVAVLGFSGAIQAAKAVMIHLGKDKLQNYSRPLIMVNLKDQLKRWIEEVTMTNLSAESRRGLSFMLCGLEPSRAATIRKGNVLVKYPQLMETHIYIFRVSQDTGTVEVLRKGGFTVIGSGAELRRDLARKVPPLISFAFNQPNLHWARAHLVGQVVNAVFEHGSVPTVGGPFQVARITAEGLFCEYIWPGSMQPTKVEVTQEGQKTIVYNPDRNETYTLHPVWSLPCQ